MKNISQKKWFSISMKLNHKENINFLYHNFYDYMIGTNQTDTELIFYFDKESSAFIQNAIRNKTDFVIKEINYENWHSNYEKYYKPIQVNEKLMIVPDWHQINNQKKDYIKISPGMAFGTGSHETTQLVITNMIKHIKIDHSVLDLGSGSGILSIAALKYGASHVSCIEYDHDCKENFLNNMKLNHINTNYSLSFDDVLTIDNYNHDLILANINKNILIDLLPRIKKLTTNTPIIILSGLLISDADEMVSLIQELDFSIIEKEEKGEWICIVIN